jgi:aldehyde dehydrogenase (NAD+)
MRPRTVKTPLTLWPSNSKIHFDPLGVVLIIGPWNYPFQLLLAPLIGAIAAGNCAVLKPSELTPNTSQLLAKIIGSAFQPEFIAVVEGGVEETTGLLEQEFDHIFFTGSTTVGRIVMQSSAKNLVPVTLELGGKSPCIVTADADLALAARRIVWGKFYNAGQTCVAPDYILIEKSVLLPMLEKIREQILVQFGSNQSLSTSFARIVNARNHARLLSLLDKDKVFYGGESDASLLYIQPTVLKDVEWGDPIMQEEIFGPIMPVFSFENIDDIFEKINSLPRPLSAYLFSSSTQTKKKFISDLSFGGGCVNDVVVHVSNPYLPFGGVGASGMGHYHGEYSFKTFSHAKSVMERYSFLDFSARYAPYNEGKLNFLRRVFRI